MMSKNDLEILNRGIKTPTPNVIREYIDCFDRTPSDSDTEKAIRRLVDVFPGNTQFDAVLLKVAAINQLYSTYVYDIHPMAKHILELNIDSRLEQADLLLVTDVATLQTDKKKRVCYSFASKYCSWHNQTNYPIYDSFVDRLLQLYCRRDNFRLPFTTSDMWCYPTFHSIIQTFQRHYGLTDFSFKEIDKFLWKYGKELYPT
jgi:hypothetical protein